MDFTEIVPARDVEEFTVRVNGGDWIVTRAHSLERVRTREKPSLSRAMIDVRSPLSQATS